MLSRLSGICVFLFVLGGCIYIDEPMPQITSSHSREIIRPVLSTPGREMVDIGGVNPGSWVPSSVPERRWTAVVIHHSGTNNGNVAIFDKWHREGNHWEGVGYNFVIGNGTDSGDGEVEVTFRWHNQITGAHCGGTAGNWANRYAVGICLVGNFNHKAPTSRQMRSLVKLTRFLQRRYGIPKSRIYGHNTTPGARITDCPGKNFSVTP